MIRIKANAKLNLFLNITGRRPDGYHELDMIMQSVSLADIVCVAERPHGIAVACGDAAAPAGEGNIAHRAAALFFARAGIDGGADIAIEKHIPMAAGMGGGSSDAAAVLYALNALYGHPLNDNQLLEAAAKTGADVPFALAGGCMRARGIGEKLAPAANMLDAWYLILKPDAGVDTPAAFARFDETGVLRPSAAHGCLAALARGDLAAFADAAFNALEAPARALCGAIDETLAYLRKAAPAAFMTGSGSACVGVFADEGAAKAVLAAAPACCTFRHISRAEERGLVIL